MLYQGLKLLLSLSIVVLSGSALAAEGPSCEDYSVIDAGPLWSNDQAQKECPAVCDDEGLAFTGGWWTTVPGQMSVCQCKPKGFVVEAGPLWSNNQAQRECPSFCSEIGGQFTGGWWTTVPGQMSVCECNC